MTDLSVMHAAGTLASAGHGCPAHMTFTEAGVVGLIQGVTELFPVSSLGHNVLIPALVGGCWAKNLNVATPESPYLAFIVGLHVATAIALLIFFWRDWVRIIGALCTSLGRAIRPPRGARRWQLHSVDEKLAWMIVLATIPVGLAGLAFEHEFRVIFGKPVYAAWFLIVNGVILIAAERFRSQRSLAGDREVAAEQETRASARYLPDPAGGAADESTLRAEERAAADRRLAGVGYGAAFLIGSAQILALLAGISRDGVTMVAGMCRLSRTDAARFAFLLATPVILAAGALKIPDLAGSLGDGVRGQVLFGSVLSFAGAYVSVRFLVRYFGKTRTLTPFGIYCLAAGLGSVIYLGLVK